MALSNKTAAQWLKEINGNTSNKPVWIGLSTSLGDPQPDGTGIVEPPENAGYSRVQLATTTMSDPTSGGSYASSTSNDEIIYLAEATGDWGTITHFCLFSSKEPVRPTGDNNTDLSLIAYGTTTSTAISGTSSSGVVPLIRKNGLTMSFSST